MSSRRACGIALLTIWIACPAPGCGPSGVGPPGLAPPPSFVDATGQIPTASSRVAAGVDLDGGGVDLFLAGDGSPRFFRNAAGSFSDRTTIVDGAGAAVTLDLSTNGMAIADLNADGRLDVVLANGPRLRAVTFTAQTSGGGKDIEISNAASRTFTALGGFQTILARRSAAPPFPRSEGLLAFPAAKFPDAWATVPSYAQLTSARLDLFQRPPTPTAAFTIELYQNLRPFSDSPVTVTPAGTTWDAWHGPGATPPTAAAPSTTTAVSAGPLPLGGVYRPVPCTDLAQAWVNDATARDNGCTVSGTASALGMVFASDNDLNPPPVTPNPAFPWRPPRLTITFVDAANTVLLNQGNGVLKHDPAQLPARSKLVTSTAVAIGDLDGLHGPDLVFANDGEPPEVLLNNGAGGFFDVSSRLPQRQEADRGVALLDVNGDGALDIVLVAAGAPAAVFIRQKLVALLPGAGAPAFVDEAATRLPPMYAPDATSLRAADCDGDGRLDLIVSTSGPTYAELWRNDGTGRFVDASASLPGASTASTAALCVDLNADGRPEMVFPDPDPAGMPVLLHGLGGGRFSDISSVLPGTGATGATTAAAADFDGDGRRDLFFGGPGGTRALYFGR